MKQAIKKKSFSAASLRQPRSARTVLLRMAADQERADRIRALKQARPDLTWRRIGDYVGVSERAAINWQKDGGMDYDNAKKLAELLEVDVDYIWRGTETDTPDPFPATFEDRIDQAEQRLTSLIEKQNELLTRQSEILERIERAIEREDEATRRHDDSAVELAKGVTEARRVLAELESAAQRPVRAAKARAK
jgi:hypothetical protein